MTPMLFGCISQWKESPLSLQQISFVVQVFNLHMQTGKSALQSGMFGQGNGCSNRTAELVKL